MRRLVRLGVLTLVVLFVVLVVVNNTVAKLPSMPPADGKYISLHGKDIHYFEQPGQGVAPSATGRTVSAIPIRTTPTTTPAR